MSDQTIDLIWLGSQETVPFWAAGETKCVSTSPRDIHAALQDYLATSKSKYWLFWGESLGNPNLSRICELLTLPGEAWHAGLRLGMAGRPQTINFVAPMWMLNRDPDVSIEATSWRLSLRACLIPVESLRQLGNVNPSFQSLEGASLELGHRLVTRGLLLRHIPWMVERDLVAPVLPLADELRFIRCRFGKFWTYWALARAVFSGYTSASKLARAWKNIHVEPQFDQIRPLRRIQDMDSIQINDAQLGLQGGGTRRPQQDAENLGIFARPPWHMGRAINETKVTVLIPTIDRYAYLRTLLSQMRMQTLQPFEIIIVDQTPPRHRNVFLADEFSDLPIRIIFKDEAGQCSSRNAGLQAARGDYVLFLDDDDEIMPDLVERHLRNIMEFQVMVSCGSAHEVGAGPLPDNFTFTRVSDVFPTNNTLIDKRILLQSGLFDLAYEHMARADGDLGMRIYLSGTLMIYNPDIAVIHHHAPSGGLRIHKARIITYASSRKKLAHRHMMSASEIYLGLRYFSNQQVIEALWINALATVAIRGSIWRKSIKFAVSSILLPDTIRHLTCSSRQAAQMLKQYPQIPYLNTDSR